MLLYTIIMLLTAALLGVFAWQIYRGNTGLIHDYHQTKVTDKAAYGKAFGKALAILAVTCVLSGLTGLLASVGWAAAVLFLGFAIGIWRIILVQKKYNGGVF